MWKKIASAFNDGRILLFLSKFFFVKKVNSQKERDMFTKTWHNIWLESGYAQPDEPIIIKYARYDKFAVDFIVKFLRIFSVGTMRLIKNNNKAGIPTINDFEIENPLENDNQIVEVTLLTVSKRFRTFPNFPFLILMKVLYYFTQKEKVKGLVIGADRRLFRLLIKIGLPFVQIGKEKFYEGSITIPAYMSMTNFEEILKRNNPLLAKFILTTK